MQFHQSDKNVKDVKHRLLQAFAKGGKQLMNRLVSIWSRAEETPRILAFMCIVKVGLSFLIGIIFHFVKENHLGFEMTSLACTRS